MQIQQEQKQQINQQRIEIDLKKNTSAIQRTFHTTNWRTSIEELTEMINTSNSLMKTAKLLTQATTDSSNHQTKKHKSMFSWWMN
jgi:hypothetical protein